MCKVFFFSCIFSTSPLLAEGNPHDIVANVLDCDTVVSEFKFQSCFYVHFQTDTIDEGMHPHFPAMG